jgi:sulfite reductase (NADPH) flavoprotein alpha-component
MQQQSKELFEWLENGAHVYICGCKDPMAKDVETTLLNIISTEANIDKAGAIEYLEKLEEEGRFAMDVY